MYSFANFGFWGSAVYIEKNGSSAFYNCYGSNIGSIPFSGDLGTFIQNSGTLKLQGGEMKTWKDANSNVCEPIMQYRVYTGSPSGSFNGVGLPWFCNCSSSSFSCGGGTCGGNDQKWQKPGSSGSGVNDDLTTLSPGIYTIQVKFEVSGNTSGTSDCPNTIYDDNGGANYSMTFTIQAPLALDITKFFASKMNQAIKLNWNANDEANLEEYVVEKSDNNINWIELTKIGKNSQSQYQYMDEQPFSNNYYRLKMIEKDGSISYSKVITMNFENAYVNIFPNPVRSILQFQGNFNAETQQIQVVDMFGRVVLSRSFSNTIDLSSLAAGAYWVKVVDMDFTEIIKKRIVKI